MTGMTANARSQKWFLTKDRERVTYRLTVTESDTGSGFFGEIVRIEDGNGPQIYQTRAFETSEESHAHILAHGISFVDSMARETADATLLTETPADAWDERAEDMLWERTLAHDSGEFGLSVCASAFSSGYFGEIVRYEGGKAPQIYYTKVYDGFDETHIHMLIHGVAFLHRRAAGRANARRL